MWIFLEFSDSGQNSEFLWILDLTQIFSLFLVICILAQSVPVTFMASGHRIWISLLPLLLCAVSAAEDVEQQRPGLGLSGSAGSHLGLLCPQTSECQDGAAGGTGLFVSVHIKAKYQQSPRGWGGGLT